MKNKPANAQETKTKHCPGCRKFLGGVCDILGEINDQSYSICVRRGYKEEHLTMQTVRVYDNTRGAL